MATTLQTHFQHLHAYEVWANQRVLASLESVPVPGRSTPSYVRATQLLPHNALARQVWLWRVLQQPYDNPKDWFPVWSIEETREEIAHVDAQWTTYLATLTDAELDRQTQYSSSDGTKYQSSIHEVLIHVFNHSTYHRGQIARIVHESGGLRAGTDFIAFGRRQF